MKDQEKRSGIAKSVMLREPGRMSVKTYAEETEHGKPSICASAVYYGRDTASQGAKPAEQTMWTS